MKNKKTFIRVTVAITVIAIGLWFYSTQRKNLVLEAKTQSFTTRNTWNIWVGDWESGPEALKICVKYGFINKCSQELAWDCKWLMSYLGINPSDLPSGVDCVDTMIVNSCEQLESNLENYLGTSLEKQGCFCDKSWKSEVVKCEKGTTLNVVKSWNLE